MRSELNRPHDPVTKSFKETKGIPSHDFDRATSADGPQLGPNSLWLSGTFRAANSAVPNMPSRNDQGGRLVTPCPKCRTGDVKAIAVASNFVYLRCSACRFLFVIEDRRRGARSQHQRRFFRW